MEIIEVTVSKKDSGSLVTRIFMDGNDIKQITDDEYEVTIKTKDSPKSEPNV